MKILKFNETAVNDISKERVEEISENLGKSLSFLRQKIEDIDSYLNELSNFQDAKRSTNDQIDDTISNLQLARTSLSDSVTNLDNSIISLEDYNKSGRKFLY